jgi:hypothetical protein
MRPSGDDIVYEVLTSMAVFPKPIRQAAELWVLLGITLTRQQRIPQPIDLLNTLSKTPFFDHGESPISTGCIHPGIRSIH